MTEAVPPVLAHMKTLGHKVFTLGDYNLNLFGIRSQTARPDKFDDLLGCAYKKEGLWVVEYWPATTDPGTYHLKDAGARYGQEGSAVLAPGQYLGAYGIGPHGASKYEALTQQHAPVYVYRDANKDMVADAVGTLHRGWFAINIHASSMRPYKDDGDRTDGEVGPWSGGCQVHATNHGFRRMMLLAKAQIDLHGAGWDKFTYTLLDQWDR